MPQYSNAKLSSAQQDHSNYSKWIWERKKKLYVHIGNVLNIGVISMIIKSLIWDLFVMLLCAKFVNIIIVKLTIFSYQCLNHHVCFPCLHCRLKLRFGVSWYNTMWGRIETPWGRTSTHCLSISNTVLINCARYKCCALLMKE